ncbi:C13 family peptidase [Metapseudomonas boanensis]|uniref:Caspase family protein n=1 Tax=Metapseudomonas boanensis TaxID=2822138 RepID=A0ABS5XCJ2_9GAMM|nr:C13 family peptidase [Pseudomonas boanensis]MBT8765418.1 caspase family protein [Pseudomonas boanensis]
MKHLLPLSLALLLAACGEGEPLTPPDARLPDGSHYRGELVDGLLQGPGRLDYSNGTWFQGQFKDGQPEGQGEWHGPNGMVYVGEFKAGLFHGRGLLTYGDGTSYKGRFKGNQFNGEGTLHQGGMTYRGEFRNDKYHGLGMLEWPDGSLYQGGFAAGQPDGEGVRTDSAGNRFSGQFRKGQLQGPGSYQGEDGSHYVGGFKDSVFDGKGRFSSAEGDVWSGTFRQGALAGEGEFLGADGSHYQGQFKDWRYQGKGQLREADGSHYQGHFSGGLYAGRGNLTLPDGRSEAGIWHEGVRIRDDQGKALPTPLEVGLLTQGMLLDQAIASLPASTPEVELYSLSLAGDGRQSVFLREADYVSRLLAERFGAHGQITLVNHREHMADRPLATRESLTRAVQAIAERSGPEDLVFIYLTSHGSPQHELALEQPGLELAPLPAHELANLLAPLRERTKVLVISACYSGGFIPAVKDDNTLVMTAARADRVSFGCSEENDFTYFGRALFAEAFKETDDLERAFDIAKAKVAEREQADDFEASEPQIWAPKSVITRWRTLREHQAKAALTAQRNVNSDKTEHSH